MYIDIRLNEKWKSNKILIREKDDFKQIAHEFLESAGILFFCVLVIKVESIIFYKYFFLDFKD